MTNEKKLREKIKTQGVKYKYLAEQLSLSNQGLLNKIKNDNDFTSTEIKKLCGILKIESLEEKEEIFFAE